MRAAVDLRLGKIRATMATKAELAEARCEALKWILVRWPADPHNPRRRGGLVPGRSEK
jgi:hypothetical protein